MDIDFLAQLYEEEEKENAEPPPVLRRTTSKSPSREHKPQPSREIMEEAHPPMPVVPSRPVGVFDPQKWKAYVRKLRHQLYLKRQPQLPSTLPGLEKQSDMIQALLERTIVAGENQSAVVVGPAGVGKKLAIRHALEQLRKISSTPFHIIHLDGAMIHSELAAFKLVMTQLCSGGIVPWNGTCYEHMYAFLRQTLKEHRLLGISSIFICDNFDSLLRSSKQILLYNLLEWMQTSDVQIALLGITRNCTFTERLEKRVQSRFSNRQIILLSPEFDTLLSILAQLLLRDLDPHDHIENHKHDEIYTHRRNDFVDHHLLSRGSRCQAYLRVWYDLGKSLRWFIHFISTWLGHWTSSDLPETCLPQTLLQLEPHDTQLLLQSLSMREFILIVGMLKLETQQKHSSYSFEMIYNEYLKFQRSAPSGQSITLSRSDGLKAFEHLLLVQLIRRTKKKQVSSLRRPRGSSSTTLSSREMSPVVALEYQLVSCRCTVQEILHVMASDQVSCPVSIQHWALHQSVVH